MSAPANAHDFVPVRPVEFQILLSLSQRDLHGYGVILETEARTEGKFRLDVATLYRALRRMEAEGLVATAPDADAGDSRRRTYTITPFGRQVARLEARRLTELVRAARGADLLDGVEPA